MPDADDFRALARSSPWLFTTLRFTRRSARSPEPVRAWLRRPGLLRVESVGGMLLDVVRGAGAVEEANPTRRPDGLVAGPRPYLDREGDPMWQDYSFVAALDPVELADGQDRLGDGSGPVGAPLEIGTVRRVEHGGRPAWEAVVTTTDSYEPRCGCCPLLRDAAIDRLEWEDWDDRFGDAVYPTATRVRLDVGTGVCVLTEALDGTWAGEGHELLVEAVDEPMDDGLFRPPPRWARRELPGGGWQEVLRQ